MELTLNPAFSDRRIAHDNIMKAVKDHSPAELKQLALLGLRSSNKVITDCFVNLPKLETLEADTTTIQIAALKNTAATPSTNS